MAQLVIARERGFASWPGLIEQLEARRIGLGGFAGLAFARAVPAGALEAQQTVVLAGRVLTVSADTEGGSRVRMMLVPVIGAAPNDTPDQRQLVIDCPGDARARSARGLSAGERLEGPGLTSGQDRFALEGEVTARRARHGQIILIAGVVTAPVADSSGERVRFVVRDPDWGEFLVVCPVDMNLPTARHKQSRGLIFEKAVLAERLGPGQIVTLDGHVMSTTIDPDDPERVRVIVVAALGLRPGVTPDQREIVISCPRDMAFGTAVPRNIQLPKLAPR
jgi:hypothetical protein